MKKKFFTLFCFSLLLCLVVFLAGKFFRISTVECVSEKPCSQEILKLLDAGKGKNYLQAKKDLGYVLSRQPKIKTYKLKYKLPSMLFVEVAERTGVVALKFAEDRYLVFDRDGSLLGEQAATELPFATVLGLASQKEMLFGVKLLNELATYYGIHEAKIDNHGLYVVLQGKGEISFPLVGDIDVVLGSLEVVLLQLNQTSQNHTIISEAGNDIRIDLRYKNPVVFGI